MTDEGGVLENLPNSRPGRRSTKRERPAKAAEKAAVKAEAEDTPASKPARTTKSRRTSAKPGRAAAGAASPKAKSRPRRTATVKTGESEDGVRLEHDRAAQVGHGRAGRAEAPGDPLSAAVRTAAALAATGVKVAGAVAQELLRRLPRP